MRGNSFLPPPGAGGTLFSGGSSPSTGSSGGHVPNGAPKGFGHALGGKTGGKGSKQENLLSPHAGMKSTITGGDPLARSMGHYGKKQGALSDVRGGGGGIKKNPRSGGLGPGPMSTPGTSDDYSMTSPDLE